MKTSLPERVQYAPEAGHYISEILRKEMDKWSLGDLIYIEAPTGRGKTEFILRELRTKAIQEGKPILYLVNRTAVVDQIKEAICRRYLGIRARDASEVNELDWFEVLTYQSIQQIVQDKILNNMKLSYKNYSYIVCDEFHYITDDAAFNSQTLYFLDFLQMYQKSTRGPRLIFLSATMGSAKEACLNYLEIKKGYEKTYQVGSECEVKHSGRVWEYFISSVSADRQLFFFPYLKDIGNFIVNSDEDEKWLVFVSNISKYKEELEPVLKVAKINYYFLDSKAVHSDDPFYKEMISEEMFSTRVLVTTKVLDVGINLKDVQLSNIVVTTDEKTSLLQEIGRKRLLDTENKPLRIFVQSREGRYFERVERYLLEELNLSKLPIPFAWKQIHNDPKKHNLFAKLFLVNQEGKLFFNCMYLARLTERLEGVHEVLQHENCKNVEEAFRSQVSKWLGVSTYEVIEADYLEKRNKDIELEQLLKHEFGGELNADKQEHLRKIIKEYMLFNNIILSGIKLSRGVGKSNINRFFAEREIKLKIESFRNTQDGKTLTFWRLKYGK